MSQKTKRFIVIGMFAIFNYVLPSILFNAGVESDWLFVVFKLLSIIAIPIFIYNVYEMSKLVNYLAISFLMIEIVYLLLGLSVSYEINSTILSIVIILNYPMLFFFAFAAATLKSEHFFTTKSVVPLILLIFIFFIRRFFEYLCTLNSVGYDIGYYTRINVDPSILALSQSRSIVFFMYAVVLYIFLEMLFYENRRIEIQ